MILFFEEEARVRLLVGEGRVLEGMGRLQERVDEGV